MIIDITNYVCYVYHIDNDLSNVSKEEPTVYARELLKGVLAEFAKTNGSREEEFPEIILVEIARDTDGAGYMLYKKALMVTLDENVWMLSMGIASGDYQASLYNRTL